MKSYSNKLTAPEDIEYRLSKRIDRIEKRITYAFIAGALIGASSIGFDVFSLVKFVL